MNPREALMIAFARPQLAKLLAFELHFHILINNSHSPASMDEQARRKKKDRLSEEDKKLGASLPPLKQIEITVVCPKDRELTYCVDDLEYIGTIESMTPTACQTLVRG